MAANTTAIAARPPASRSRIANGSRLFFADGRSSGARLAKDTIIELADELFGGLGSVPASLRGTLESAAALRVECLRLMSVRAAGGEIDALELVTVSNAAERVLAKLRAAAAKRAPSDPVEALNAYFAGRTTEKAKAEEPLE